MLVPADYDEIILESRSSELMLRNLKSDISGGPQMPFGFQRRTLIKMTLPFVSGLWIWMLKRMHLIKAAVSGEHIVLMLVFVALP